MVPDLDALRERLVASLVATVAPMLAPVAHESLYVMALTTDSDCITVRLVAHTEEALDLITGGEDDPDVRWWPDEWAIANDDVTPDGGHESTAQIAGSLYEMVDELDPDWPAAAREVFDAALGDLRVRRAIAGVNPSWDPVLFVTDTDGDLARTVVSLVELNREHPDRHLVDAAVAYFAGG